MNLYAVTLRLPGKWKITGEVEAGSYADAASEGRKAVTKILEPFVDGGSRLNTPTVRLIRRNSEKRYKVVSTFENLKTGEKRVVTHKHLYKNRDTAHHVAARRNESWPEGRRTSEVVEVPA